MCYCSPPSDERSLVNARYNHECCGVGFVANLYSPANHGILRLALVALARLAHRRAVSADGKSSDGVGVLTAVPRKFFLQASLNLSDEKPLAIGTVGLKMPVCPRLGDRSRAAMWYSVEPISLTGTRTSVTWIKTIPLSEASEALLQALESQRALYPGEYRAPVFSTENPAPGIVASHSLIPDALFHAFATFGVLMSPDLPLTRRQHEMITTMVSVTNRCFY